MRKYEYIFRTVVHFDKEISQHYFQLRTLPYISSFQYMEKEDIVINPCENLMFGSDSFGNRVQSGFVLKSHTDFEFMVSGVIVLYSYLICEELNNIFLIPSSFTRTNREMENFLISLEIEKEDMILQKALRISDGIHHIFKYQSGLTDTGTTALIAFDMRKGVCQDFAHIMVALCRLARIPARYVNGFIPGEGASHAWVEIYDSGVWYGIDPTHNQLIEEGYIKVAHGRDFADCAMDKGIFIGNAKQKIDVTLKMQEI